MSSAFAFGAILGSALVVFGRDTPMARGLLVRLHVQAARLKRWLTRR